MKTVLTSLSALMLAATVCASNIAVIDMETILEAHPNTPNDKKLLETTLVETVRGRYL